MKCKNEFLLRVTLTVLYRATQEFITSFELGDFDTIRQSEKFRDQLARFNPDKLFIAKYEQIINPDFKIVSNESNK